VVQFQWLKDAEHAARVNVVWFNHKTLIDKKLRKFINVGLKKPIVPAIKEKDPYDDGSVITDRAHQRYIAADAMSQLLYKTIPQRKLDHNFREVDIRHQYLDDDDCLKICKAIQDSHTIAELNLSHNRITDKGAKSVLKMLKHNTVITQVLLHHQRPEVCYTSQLRVGQPVEARWGGKHSWYPARVIGLHSLDELGFSNQESQVCIVV
jgi:hypothetical protein